MSDGVLLCGAILLKTTEVNIMQKILLIFFSSERLFYSDQSRYQSEIVLNPI